MDKELVQKCNRILNFFDTLARESRHKEEFPITNFIDVYQEFDSLDIDEHLKDDLADIFSDLRGVAFALGFVVGQNYEITYPEANDDIDAIEKMIRERALLPYVIREKERRVT